MATKSSTTPPPTLQRGKACLRCRKRKMRCDGIKPACQQCVRAKKPEGCQYDDGRGKTRTQLLRENIERLEQRIRELEDPEYTSPSVTLHDPHLHQRSESSSSSLAGSPPSTGFSAPHSPFPPSATSSPQSYWMHGVPSPSPTPFTDAFHQLDPHPNIDLAQMLVDIFSPHQHQCLLGINMPRLRDSFTRPPAEQHHPVLTNAIFLWACYISRPGPLSEHEPQYLTRTLESLPDALQYDRHTLDVIQASTLLALYFLSNGRAIEGGYHASAAAALAVQCSLHGAVGNRASVFDAPGATMPSLTKLPPPKDAIEQGERILTFWQVFVLDRCWSVILSKPPTIPDGGADRYTSIVMPWPQDMEEYEAGQIDDLHAFSSTRSFFDGPISNLGAGFSPLALRVKASVLFHRAYELAASWCQSPPLSTGHTHGTPPTTPPLTTMPPTAPSSPTSASLSVPLYDTLQTLEHTILRFISTLLPIHQLDAAMPEDRHAYVMVYVLAYAALVVLFGTHAHLGQTFGYGGGGGGGGHAAREKAVRAARGCAMLVKHVAEGDYEYLDPVVGPCWTYALDVLVRELGMLESEAASAWSSSPDVTIPNHGVPHMNGMNGVSNHGMNGMNGHTHAHTHAHTHTIPDIRHDIGTLLYAMSTLARRFPVMGYAVGRAQKRLGGVM